MAYLLKAGVYLICFVISWYACSSLQYEKLLKKGHVTQAQILYFLIVIALAYLVGSFILVFLRIS